MCTTSSCLCLPPPPSPRLGADCCGSSGCSVGKDSLFQMKSWSVGSRAAGASVAAPSLRTLKPSFRGVGMLHIGRAPHTSAFVSHGSHLRHRFFSRASIFYVGLDGESFVLGRCVIELAEAKWGPGVEGVAVRSESLRIDFIGNYRSKGAEPVSPLPFLSPSLSPSLSLSLSPV